MISFAKETAMKYFYSKSPGNDGYIKNMEVVGYSDLNGIYAFQTQLWKTDEGKYYLYCGSLKGTGVNILDVTDPSRPEIVDHLQCLDPQEYTYAATPKVQVCDGLLMVALDNGFPKYHGPYPEGGFKKVGGLQIYDIKDDPVHPKMLSWWKTNVEGGDVHRFCYNGGRYAHITAPAKGFSDKIYYILDVSDPAHPFEVGRWFMEKQCMLTKTQAEIDAMRPEEKEGVHCVFVEGNYAYISAWSHGFYIVDISDPTCPQTVGHLAQCPPFSGKLSGARCHTFLPILGTDFAIGTHEGGRFTFRSEEQLEASGAQPMNTIIMMDIKDKTDPTMIAIFPYPEVPEDYPFKNFNFCGQIHAGSFGPHNMHEPMSNKPWLENRRDRAYNSYFHAGLRVYDISDPYYIKELAYFIPPNPEKLLFNVDIPGPLLAQAEDCVVDDRGYIYMNALHDGLYILKCLV